MKKWRVRIHWRSPGEEASRHRDYFVDAPTRAEAIKLAANRSCWAEKITASLVTVIPVP